MTFRLSLLFSLLLITTPAWSYLDIGGSAEIPKLSNGGLQIQSLTDSGGGTLFNGFYDMAHSDEVGSRFSLGLGTIDYNLGAAIKWTPFPDTKSQPAVGFRAAFWYAKNKDFNITTVQIAPVVSKRFVQDFGTLIPFAALALNFNTLSGGGESASANGTQLSIGSELHHNKLDNMFFTAELGSSIKDAISFIALSVTVPMAGDKAFFKRK